VEAGKWQSKAALGKQNKNKKASGVVQVVECPSTEKSINCIPNSDIF
jgi:hypothetical protein